MCQKKYFKSEHIDLSYCRVQAVTESTTREDRRCFLSYSRKRLDLFVSADLKTEHEDKDHSPATGITRTNCWKEYRERKSGAERERERNGKYLCSPSPRNPRALLPSSCGKTPTSPPQGQLGRSCRRPFATRHPLQRCAEDCIYEGRRICWSRSDETTARRGATGGTRSPPRPSSSSLQHPPGEWLGSAFKKYYLLIIIISLIKKSL